MKHFIKILLRENLFKSDAQLPPDVMKKITQEVKAAFEKEQEKKAEIEGQIDRFNAYLKDERAQKDPSIIDAIKKIVKEKEQELKNYNHTYENILAYYIRQYKHMIDREKAEDDYRKEMQSKGITKERIIDLFVTALEGGSNYWYDIQNVPKDVQYNVEYNDISIAEAIADYVLNGGYIQFNDIENEDEVLGYVDMDKLLDAINLLKKDYPDVYDNIVMEYDDANDADIFLQLAVMGEVQFG